MCIESMFYIRALYNTLSYSKNSLRDDVSIGHINSCAAAACIVNINPCFARIGNIFPRINVSLDWLEKNRFIICRKARSVNDIVIVAFQRIPYRLFNRP